jgi:hypothetical protein
MKLEELKTMGQILQEIVNEDYYSLHEFLLDSTEEYRKEVESKMTDIDYKQYYAYLDSLEFENRDQLESEICQYLEYVNQQPLGMGEMFDVSDMADDYIEHRGLPFNDED